MDIRYYSFAQFDHVALFTIYIFLIIASYINGYYKMRDFKLVISLINIWLFINFFFSFVYWVVSSPHNLYFNVLGIIFLILHILFCIYFHIRIHLEKKGTLKMRTIILLLFIIPCTCILINPVGIVYYSILFLLHSHLLSNKWSRYSISSDILHNVKSMIMDYVFILDKNKNILFMSDNINKSSFFNKVMKIEPTMTDLFNGKIRFSNLYNKDVIELQKERICYLEYNKKEIYNNGEICGFVITFVDISDYIKLLNELKIKKTTLLDINKYLNSQKEIIYEIERESEVEKLLKEISDNQEKSIKTIQMNLEKIDLNSPIAIKKIEKIIEMAKKNLITVRQAVTTYVDYYKN